MTQAIEITNGLVLAIPRGWDHFTYHGQHYVRDTSGNFVVGDAVTLAHALDDESEAHVAEGERLAAERLRSDDREWWMR